MVFISLSTESQVRKTVNQRQGIFFVNKDTGYIFVMFKIQDSVVFFLVCALSLLAWKSWWCDSNSSADSEDQLLNIKLWRNLALLGIMSQNSLKNQWDSNVHFLNLLVF